MFATNNKSQKQLLAFVMACLAAPAVVNAENSSLTIEAGMTMITQSMSAATDDTGATYSADIALSSDLGGKGEAFVSLNTAQGTAVNPGSGAGGVNADDEAGDFLTLGGYSETRVAEAWFSLPLGNMFDIMVGKIDPTGIYDANAVANDETSQFLGDVFVNNAAIEFPGYTAGVNLTATVTDSVALNLGIFEPTDDFEGTGADNFAIAEISLSGDVAGWNGNLRLTSWKNSLNDNEGMAINGDLEVTDDIALFVRYGTQEDSNAYDEAMSLGGAWSLGDDAVGFAYSIAGAVSAPGAVDEKQVEIYYNHAFSDHIHVTADYQTITNPNFASGTDVSAYGIRVQVDM